MLEGRDLSTHVGGGETRKILSLNITPSNTPTGIMNLQMASLCMYLFLNLCFLQKDDMQRVVGGGFRIENSCTPVADSCQCKKKKKEYVDICYNSNNCFNLEEMSYL